MLFLFDCQSKGPSPLQRPPEFQHETLRKFLLSSRKYFFAKYLAKYETSAKDRRGIHERFAKFVFSAKNGGLQVKEFKSNAICT